MVELLKEVLVFMLNCRVVVLVFHLKHNGDDLVTILVALTENEVALCAATCVVVLLKVRIGKRRHAQTIELNLTVLLERLAHHLGGETRLHVAQTLNLLLLIAQNCFVILPCLLHLELMGSNKRLLLALTHRELLSQLRASLVALTLNLLNRLSLLKLGIAYLLRKLRPQTISHRARCSLSLFQFAVCLRLRLSHCHLLHLLCTLQLGTQLSQLALLRGHRLAQLGCNSLLLVASLQRSAMFCSFNLHFQRGLHCLSLSLELFNLSITLVKCLLQLHLGVGALGFKRQVLCRLHCCRLGFELLNLCIALPELLLQLCLSTSALHLQRLCALTTSSLLTLFEIVSKLGIAHLLNDIGVARLVYRKKLSTMGALNLIHGNLSFLSTSNLARIVLLQSVLLKPRRLRLHAVKKRKDIVPAHRAIVVCIYPYVVAQNAVFAIALVIRKTLTVNVPMQHDARMPLTSPRQHGIVRKYQSMPLCKAWLNL